MYFKFSNERGGADKAKKSYSLVHGSLVTFLFSSHVFQKQETLLQPAYISIDLFLAVLGFEFRNFHLLGRCSTAWAIPTLLFALVILEMGSHFFCPGQPGLWFSYFTLLAIAGMTGAYLCSAIGWDEIWETICPRWPCYHNPSELSLPRITDMSHQSPASTAFDGLTLASGVGNRVCQSNTNFPVMHVSSKQAWGCLSPSLFSPWMFPAWVAFQVPLMLAHIAASVQSTGNRPPQVISENGSPWMDNPILRTKVVHRYLRNSNFR
jgi:hypothetical protein